MGKEMSRTQIASSLAAIEERIEAADSVTPNGHRELDYQEQDYARYHLIDAWRALRVLCENLGNEVLRQEVEKRYSDVEQHPLATDICEDPFYVWSWEAWRLVQLIRGAYNLADKARVSDDLETLVERLRRCKAYVMSSLFAWLPTNEADVHDRIEEFLECCYGPVHRKPPMPPQIIKNKFSDTGIPAISALVEYKFLEKQGDVARIVDEIKGVVPVYQESGYDSVVFAVYETHRFHSEEAWQSEAVNACHPIKPTRVVVLEGVPYTEDDNRRAASRRAQAQEIAQPNCSDSKPL